MVLYEVRKSLLFDRGKSKADSFYSEACEHFLVSFDETLAMFGVELSRRHKLPMGTP